MLINWNQLKKIPVYTQSGTNLGRVAGFEVDVDSHTIRAYFVRKILRPELSIHREQVISITSQRMTVEDGVVREGGLEQKIIKVKEEASPVPMSQLEN